jgi:hypothetical protein
VVLDVDDAVTVMTCLASAVDELSGSASIGAEDVGAARVGVARVGVLEVADARVLGLTGTVRVVGVRVVGVRATGDAAGPGDPALLVHAVRASATPITAAAAPPRRAHRIERHRMDPGCHVRTAARPATRTRGHTVIPSGTTASYTARTALCAGVGSSQNAQVTPIRIRGCAAGRNHRMMLINRCCGIDTQPAVG